MKRLQVVREALSRVLRSNLAVLESWRRVRLTQSGRLKNFENWLQVQLALTIDSTLLRDGKSDRF